MKKCYMFFTACFMYWIESYIQYFSKYNLNISVILKDNASECIRHAQISSTLRTCMNNLLFYSFYWVGELGFNSCLINTWNSTAWKQPHLGWKCTFSFLIVKIRCMCMYVVQMREQACFACEYLTYSYHQVTQLYNCHLLIQFKWAFHRG